ncbi:MAG: InlB B-repeat-containing protein [Eubacterium sp.]|nr:InlB B-repeat-containing protein [Eubacterium sp.]
MNKRVLNAFQMKKRNGLGFVIMLILALLATAFPPMELFSVKEARAENCRIYNDLTSNDPYYNWRPLVNSDGNYVDIKLGEKILLSKNRPNDPVKVIYCNENGNAIFNTGTSHVESLGTGGNDFIRKEQIHSGTETEDYYFLIVRRPNDGLFNQNLIDAGKFDHWKVTWEHTNDTYDNFKFVAVNKSPDPTPVPPAISRPNYNPQPISTPYVYKYYGITYVMNGGTNDPRNPSSYREDQNISLYDAWKTGATFDGWYISPDGYGRVATICNRSVTVYAHFTPFKYKINYVLSGGIMESGNPDSYEYGETPSLPVEPTKENCQFAGWSLSPDGSNPSKTFPAVTSGDVTLYAVFQPVYHITYVLDGGENSPYNPTTYLATETVTLEAADKYGNGMRFMGWYDAPVGGNLVTTVSGGDITVYARFVEAYNIFYDCDGGTNHKNNPDYYEVEKGAILNDPYKKGYDFVGWVVDGTDKLIHSIPAGQTGNMILHAKWTPVPDLKGATVYLNHDQGLVYNATGQSVSLKKIVTKDGVVITNFKHCKVLGLTAREAGTHEVTVKGDGDRYTGKCTAKFKIAKARMLDAKIRLSQIAYYFEPGVKNKPNVQFYLNGIRMNMKLDKDYTAMYDKDVIHAGKKSVVVRTTEDCNNLTIGEFTVTYEVKKSDTKFTAKVSPCKISIRDLKDDVQKAQVTITNLTKGSSDVRFSINTVSDIDRKNFVTVDSESGRVTLYPARWGECKIEISCTSHANADRKKLVKYVSIVVQ